MTDEELSIRSTLNMRPEDAIRAFRSRDQLRLDVDLEDLEPEERARTSPPPASTAWTCLLSSAARSIPP